MSRWSGASDPHHTPLAINHPSITLHLENCHHKMKEWEESRQLFIASIWSISAVDHEPVVGCIRSTSHISQHQSFIHHWPHLPSNPLNWAIISSTSKNDRRAFNYSRARKFLQHKDSHRVVNPVYISICQKGFVITSISAASFLSSKIQCMQTCHHEIIRWCSGAANTYSWKEEQFEIEVMTIWQSQFHP
jgi:hypothetical protein